MSVAYPSQIAIPMQQEQVELSSNGEQRETRCVAATRERKTKLDNTAASILSSPDLVWQIQSAY